MLSGCIIPQRFEHSEIIYKERSPNSKLTIKKIFDTRKKLSAIMAEKYVQHKISYRISIDADTIKKESYSYCSRGALFDIYNYVATEEEISADNYKFYFRLTREDKFVLNKIDSVIRSERFRLEEAPAYEAIRGFKLVSRQR